MGTVAVPRLITQELSTLLVEASHMAWLERRAPSIRYTFDRDSKAVDSITGTDILPSFRVVKTTEVLYPTEGSLPAP